MASHMLDKLIDDAKAALARVEEDEAGLFASLPGGATAAVVKELMSGAVLELSKSLRPRAKWGYWMFPVNPFNSGAANVNYNNSNCHQVPPDGEWRCTYDDPVLGGWLRSFTDRQLPIWKASTGICAFFCSAWLA